MKKKIIIPGLLLSLLFPLCSNAQEASSSSLSTTSSSTIVEEENEAVSSFTVCSQMAIEVRDTAIANSRSLYNIAMTKALTTRKNNEKAAVALSPDEDKKDAIKLSVETYKSQTKNAQNLLVQARKEAWQTFENDIKKCRELQVDSLDAIKEENYGSQKKAEVNEAKSIKDTLKSQFENLKSLFN